jgi:hypothetical protein
MHSAKRVRRTLEEVARQVARRLKATERGRVNVVVKKNVRVAANIGRPGATTVESTSKEAPS